MTRKGRQGSSLSLPLCLSLKIREPLKMRGSLLGQVYNLLRLDSIILYYIATEVKLPNTATFLPVRLEKWQGIRKDDASEFNVSYIFCLVILNVRKH